MFFSQADRDHCTSSIANRVLATPFSKSLLNLSSAHSDVSLSRKWTNWLSTKESIVKANNQLELPGARGYMVFIPILHNDRNRSVNKCQFSFSKGVLTREANKKRNETPHKNISSVLLYMIHTEIGTRENHAQDLVSIHSTRANRKRLPPMVQLRLYSQMVLVLESHGQRVRVLNARPLVGCVRLRFPSKRIKIVTSGGHTGLAINST